MNRELLEEACRQACCELHELARDVHVDPFFLVGPVGARAVEGAPFGLMRALASRLGVRIEDLTESPIEPEQVGDDTRLEAAMAAAGAMCRDDIAYVFGWPLERVERALAALATRLRSTGRTLVNTSWHTYELAASCSLLTTEEQGRLRHRGPCSEIVDPDMVNALGLVASGWTDKATWATSAPWALARLRKVGLVADDGAHVTLTAEVRFSLRLDEDEHTVADSKCRSY